MEEKWHGTPGGYSNHRCRCDDCRLAWNAYQVEYKSRKMTDLEALTHGKASSYRVGCRCADCKDANQRAYRTRKLASMGVNRPRPELCDCCNKVTDRLVLDHDHATGKFRGWLCHTCNTGLGKLGDTVEGLERALDYLRANTGRLEMI